jgi:hypothetical protein
MKKDYVRYLEDKFKVDIVQIIQDLRDDQTARSEWDSQALDGWRIRNSELPTTETLENLKNYKGVFFKDNWVKKSFTWLKSYLAGADVYADIKSYDGIIEPNMELLENEVNFSMSLSNMINIVAKAVEDKLYVGYGVVRTYFDTRRINNFWKTGTPVIEFIDARNVWFKCNNNHLDNISRMFHAEAVDTNVLKEQVAQYDKKLAEQIKVDEGSDGYVKFPNTMGRTIVYTGVFKQVDRVEKREFIYESTDYETGETKTENWFEFEQEYQESDKQMPEGVYVSDDTIEIDQDCWYQIMFIPSQSIILKQPIKENDKQVWKDAIHIGDIPNYHILGGAEQDGSSYPFGDAYDMKDVLDLSVVFMSSLSKQIGNMNKPQPQIFEDAIDNINEFTNKHWKQDFTLKLRPEFFKDNPNISPDKAVTYKQTPINDRLFLVMQNYIGEVIKTSTGAVDSARGEQQYSGQSGVLANQLQQASQTYLVSDENMYRAFIDSILNWLMKSIVEFRQFPHKVKGLDEMGQTTARDVNTNMNNTLKDDNYFVEANLQPAPEQKKQMEKQQVMELLNSGKFPLKSALEIMDLSSVNVDRVMEELQQERGLDQIAEWLENYPELGQMIQQAVQQLEQGGQDGTNAS